MGLRAGRLGLESHNTSTVALLKQRRSDSNGEDLEGYAGAGLYESITMDPTSLVRVDYNDDPITADDSFRHKVRADPTCVRHLA